jgi:spore coat protein U-like protein
MIAIAGLNFRPPWHRAASFLAVLIGCIVFGAETQAARTCTVTVFPLAFGVYTPITPTPVDSTALIQVACVGDPDPGDPGFYTIGISGGASGDPASRYMPSGPSRLSYNLFQDASFTTIWGDGSSGTNRIAQPFPIVGGMGMGMGTPPFNMDHTVYGRSFAGQDPAPGNYADAPIVTIEF